jgi:hypothetical protein
VNIEWGHFLLQTLISALLSSSVIALVGGLMLQRRTEQISAAVRHQFEQALLRYQSTLQWKEQAVTELLGPLVMQFDRTQRAFNRWTAKNLYIETKIIREGNETVRNLLLSKGHLIPPDLLPDAGRLVEHYDRWLEEYKRVRGGTEPQLDTPFVFAGPEGYPFPADAEQWFRERFRMLWEELYGTKP